MKKLFVLTVLSVFVMSACVHATTVDWMGLTWDLRGADTTAVVNSQGHLDISVLGGQTKQGPDNWNVYATLPSILSQANAPWVEFRFLDFPVNNIGTSARAFIDTTMNGQETMLQGGSLAYYYNMQGYEMYGTNYLVNTATYSGGWGPTEWFNAGTRTDGEHSFLIGMTTSGRTDLYFNGVLQGSFGPDVNFDFFQKAFLGINGTNGQTLNATYTSFTYGTDYVPEPGTMVALGSGILGLAGYAIRRRK